MRSLVEPQKPVEERASWSFQGLMWRMCVKKTDDTLALAVDGLATDLAHGDKRPGSINDP